jgi:hypothetical protein
MVMTPEQQEYLSNPIINRFIDVLVIYTRKFLEPGVMDGYDEAFIHGVISEFWIIGRVIFDKQRIKKKYSSSCTLYSGNYFGIYDPEELCTVFQWGSVKITTMMGEDITENVLFLARRCCPLDLFGTSIIANGRITAFDPNAFNIAYKEAIDSKRPESIIRKNRYELLKGKHEYHKTRNH